jgi:tetratricopeptide (TPR) repeat protein
VAPSARQLPSGTRLGHYRLLAPLGRGGASTVYRALDLDGQREVALKVLAPAADADLQAWSWRLRREFYQMAQLDHPHIVRVLDWGEDGELHHYAMDLIEGRDGSDLAPLPAPDVIEVLAAIGSALALVHARGLLHQDIKPHNIRIPDGAGGQPRPAAACLMDFGLMRPIGDPGGDRAGTRGFMAPEVLLGAPPDERADLYGLGATGYALLFGRPPPQPMGLTDSTPPLAAAPAELGALLGELLAADPRRRPPSMAEVLARLCRLGATASVSDETRAGSYLTRPPLVDRTAALGALRAASGQAHEGQGQVAFVVATPGLGRTRLLADFALELRVAGAEVGQARGAGGLPFGSLSQLLWPWLSERELMAALPTAARAALDSLATMLSISRAPEPATLADAAASLLHRAQARRPVALVVDDLDACDAASLAALEHLAGRVRGRCLLLASLSAEPAQREALVRRLQRGAARVVVLEPLRDDAVQAFLDGLFGGARLSRALVDTLTTRSGGNPAHLLALCRGLLERGTLRYHEGQWQLPRLLDGEELGKTGREGAVSGRAPATDDEHQLVALLEIAQGHLDATSLATAAELPPRQFLAALEALRLRGTVTLHGLRADAAGGGAGAEPTIAGSTAVTAPPAAERVVLDPLVTAGALTDDRRRQLSARLAQALRQRLGRPQVGDAERSELQATLGRLLLGLGGDRAMEGASWLARAGQADFRRGAFQQAAGSLEVAARHLDQHGGPAAHPALLDLWEQLGVCQVSGDTSAAIAYFERLLRHLDRRGELARIVAAEGRLGPRLSALSGLVRVAVDRALDRRAGSILELPAELERYARTVGFLGAVLCMVGELDLARRHIERLDLLTRARGGEVVAAATFAWANYRFGRGHFEEAARQTQRTLQILATEHDGGLPPDQRERIRLWSWFVGCWVKSQRVDPGLDLEELATLQPHDEMMSMHALMLPVMYHAGRGEVTRMLAARATLFQRCFRLRPTYHECYVYPPCAQTLLDAGLVTQLREDVASLRALDHPAGPLREMMYRVVPGLLALGEGAPGRALELFDEALAVARRPESGPNHMVEIHALEHSADACLRLGRHREAAARAHAAVDMSRDPGVGLRQVQMRALRHLARIHFLEQQHERAARRLAEARRIYAGWPCPGESAELDLAEAEVTLAQGREAEAARLAALAEESMTGLGNPAGARRALVLRQRALAAGSTHEVVRPATPDERTEIDARREGVHVLHAPATEIDPRDR